MKILLTSTSFQDTPGAHQELLEKQEFEVIKLRGPLKEEHLINIIHEFDGIICGDDEISRSVIEKGVQGKLKIISKYGTGLDKIDLIAAQSFNLPVLNCPGINQITVAEHVFALLLSYAKNIVKENDYIKNQKWVRLIGSELFEKTIGIFGTGNVGMEVAKRAVAFGMDVIAYDKFRNEEFATKYGVKYCDTPLELISKSDIISLNLTLVPETHNIIGLHSLGKMKDGVIIINTARAGLIDENAILEGINSGKIKAYLTDVLEEEPIVEDHPFLSIDSILITPHIGSRTYENVVKQGTMSVKNLLKYL